MIYILGINSFIGRNFYLKLKREKLPVFCLSHADYESLHAVTDNDTIINFCGVNRATTETDYNDGNFIFVKDIINVIKKGMARPYFIHISSLMVHGFLDKQLNDLPEYQRYFIISKLNAERYIIDNYPDDKLCIIRPSNIYGYDCQPYTNNLLVTLIYEKITQNYKTFKINKNCIRNFLSIDGLCDSILSILRSQRHGIYNIVSNNSIDLQSLLQVLYNGDIPELFDVLDGDLNRPGNVTDHSQTICVDEDLRNNVASTEEKMKHYIKLNDYVLYEKKNRLSQPRGDMVEISSLHGKRLYMITIAEHAIRGNHCHFEQIEHFYMSCGRAIYLLSHKDNPNIILFKILNRDDSIIIKPPIIHTLINDFVANKCEVFVVSTQEFIANQIPDTQYINII
jgi:nucleoside-diphosphate-sugar epimerase